MNAIFLVTGIASAMMFVLFFVLPKMDRTNASNRASAQPAPQVRRSVKAMH